MRRTLFSLAIATAVLAQAQQVSVKWELSNPDNLGDVAVSGDAAYTEYVTPSLELGSCISKYDILASSGASDGYTAVAYDPAFTQFYVTTKTTTRTAGHCVEFLVAPQSGHSFKPIKIEFDAVRCGTDGGGMDVCVREANGPETLVATALLPNRNRVDGTNPDAYSHYEYSINDFLVSDQSFVLTIYLHNINGVDSSSPKSYALRNVSISGAVDEAIYTADHYVSALTFTNYDGDTIDLATDLATIGNGDTYAYPTKLPVMPSDLAVQCATGYDASVTYDGNVAQITICQDEAEVFTFYVRFTIKAITTKGKAKPLGRGLMAVCLTDAEMGTGNLISWRHREADGYGVKYAIARGNSPDGTFTYLGGSRGKISYIKDRTNYLDAAGNSECYYKLEVYDLDNNLLETEISPKAWEGQTLYIPIDAPAKSSNGAIYNPNDASFCDMDGDGEYEIILKWSPSDEKDAASTGTTSNPIFDCYKLDGTRLWRIDLGPNFFTSAHTIQFIAWDLDGDGYGEFMCKTAPGTIDGEGNYVIMDGDDPEANWLNSRGKQVEGPEYITVFDGMTGAELATIPYHTNYADGASYWGDSNQNRSERYLAALAYLDGYDKNPSAIFARGYYAGAFVGAYDWDGSELTLRWLSSNTTKNAGLWGEGAHWISVGDCDGDGKQEIIYGSAALDHDGSLLYRTGLGHGDALHLGDFLTDRDGLEVFMVHEETPYGLDLRDAATGEILWRVTASSDTGRGLAAHFDSSKTSAQCLYSASSGIWDLESQSQIASSWAIGSSGAAINNRIYWTGDLYDDFYDKSVLAHWNPDSKSFDRIKVNNTYYTIGTLNNSTKYNPCVLGDILGDWREEIITHDGTLGTTSASNLIINATSYETSYRIPHLMDDPQYRVQVVNQNCCYNQPPHLSFDPSIKYAGNPNNADNASIASITRDEPEGDPVIYNLQGIRVKEIRTPGLYIVNGEKTVVR